MTRVNDYQSMDYTLDEVDEELQLIAKHGQWLQELLATSREGGFTEHPEFKQAQRSVLGEVQAQVNGAESWLEKVRADLYAAAVASRRTRAVDTRRAGAEVKAQPGDISEIISTAHYRVAGQHLC
jgi:hypothetical protein